MIRNTFSLSFSFTLSVVARKRPRTLTRARARTCTALGASLAVVALASPLQGQRVTGRVLDDGTGERVPFAQVTLVAAANGASIASLMTDSAGYFVLQGKAGRVRITAYRIGYATYSSEAVELRKNENISVVLRLAAQGIRLPPIEITARGRDERGRDGFDRRRALGKGWFLTLDSIRARNPIVPINLFDGIPGVVVVDGGTTPVLYSMSSPAKCFVVYRDHMPMGLPRRIGGTARDAGVKPDPRLNQLLTKEQQRLGVEKEENPVDRIPLADIRGIEIYRNRSELPRELLTAARIVDLWKVARRNEGFCGMIWMWTQAGW